MPTSPEMREVAAGNRRRRRPSEPSTRRRQPRPERTGPRMDPVERQAILDELLGRIPADLAATATPRQQIPGLLETIFGIDLPDGISSFRDLRGALGTALPADRTGFLMPVMANLKQQLGLDLSGRQKRFLGMERPGSAVPSPPVLPGDPMPPGSRPPNPNPGPDLGNGGPIDLGGPGGGGRGPGFGPPAPPVVQPPWQPPAQPRQALMVAAAPPPRQVLGAPAVMGGAARAAGPGIPDYGAPPPWQNPPRRQPQPPPGDFGGPGGGGRGNGFGPPAPVLPPDPMPPFQPPPAPPGPPGGNGGYQPPTLPPAPAPQPGPAPQPQPAPAPQPGPAPQPQPAPAPQPQPAPAPGTPGLPLDPYFEQQRRLLDDTLAAELARVGVAREQIPLVMNLVTQRLATNQALDDQRVNEAAAARGVYDSTFRTTDLSRVASGYDRQRQDLAFDTAERYRGLADAESAARGNYNRGLAEALMALAARASTDPYSPIPSDGGTGTGGNGDDYTDPFDDPFIPGGGQRPPTGGGNGNSNGGGQRPPQPGSGPGPFQPGGGQRPPTGGGFAPGAGQRPPQPGAGPRPTQPAGRRRRPPEEPRFPRYWEKRGWKQGPGGGWFRPRRRNA